MLEDCIYGKMRNDVCVFTNTYLISYSPDSTVLLALFWSWIWRGFLYTNCWKDICVKYRSLYIHNRYKATHLHFIFNTMVNIYFYILSFHYSCLDVISIKNQIISAELLFFSRIAWRGRKFKCEKGFYSILLRKLKQKKRIVKGCV